MFWNCCEQMNESWVSWYPRACTSLYQTMGWVLFGGGTDFPCCEQGTHTFLGISMIEWMRVMRRGIHRIDDEWLEKWMWWWDDEFLDSTEKSFIILVNSASVRASCCCIEQQPVHIVCQDNVVWVEKTARTRTNECSVIECFFRQVEHTCEQRLNLSRS